MKKPSPSFLTWIFVYLISPLLWIKIVMFYKSRKDDKNCIKSERYYSSGEIRVRAANEISMKKTKALAKKMGLTFNDAIMGLISKSMKEYF